MNLYIAQIKRELWENKFSFIYTPAFITLLIVVMVISTAVYSKGKIDSQRMNFSFSATSNESSSVGNPNQNSVSDEEIHQRVDIASLLTKHPDAFNGMVISIMYANCAMLYLVLSIIMSSYSLRCLYDDRKNRDILFWRSMPVSETTNVLIKLLMVIVLGPLVIFLLNLFMCLVSFLCGFAFFGLMGLNLGSLISSVAPGELLVIIFQIFYEMVFSLLMLLPVIGFAFFASALAKRSPFVIFASPALLALADKMLNTFVGINLHVLDVFELYARMLLLTKSAFILGEHLHFNQAMVQPLIICVVIGLLFIGGSIWLRNNRYEI